jgi:hypothetical protein
MENFVKNIINKEMDGHEYFPGLTWTQFCKKFAKNNGLTYNQAVSVGREAYHEYKLQEARLVKQKEASYTKQQQPKKSGKKSKAPADSEYQAFMQWKAAQEAPSKPKKKRKVVTYVTDSSSDDESD